MNTEAQETAARRALPGEEIMGARDKRAMTTQIEGGAEGCGDTAFASLSTAARFPRMGSPPELVKRTVQPSVYVRAVATASAANVHKRRTEVLARRSAKAASA